MKSITKILIIALTIHVFSIQVSYAHKAAPEPVSLKQILINHIDYPDFLAEKGNGFVLIAITVKEDGTVNLSEINASSMELLTYMVNEVEKIKIDDPYVFSGQTYYYKIEFVYSPKR